MTGCHVVVAGAGPVGVVTAMAAAQQGFRVTLLEAAATIDDSPRASTFHPSTLEMINRLGIMDEFVAVGLVARYFEFWDKVSRTRVARMDHEVLRGETPFPFVVQTEQHKLTRIGLDRLSASADVDVRTGWSVVDVVQDAAGVTVTASSVDGRRDAVRGDWLVGCDGGRSAVRKLLGVEFEGYTWPERFLVLTTPFDMQRELGCVLRNYFADPEEWANLFKVAGDDLKGRWRVVSPTRPDESDEEALSDEGAQRRLRRIVGGDDEVELFHRNLYRVHQRVATRFRVGRAFLAGDAAHVNNPIGGLGLNCGVHDAFELVDTLAEADGRADDEGLLDRYERRRRSLNIEFVQQQTVDNKRRLEEKDPARRRARLDELAAIADDEDRQRAFLRRTSLLDSVKRARAIQ